MTLNELRAEVGALGFEPGANTDPILISAANRALSMISAELPVYKTLLSPPLPYSPSYFFETHHHVSESMDYFPLPGRAYSFWVSGKGKFSEITMHSEVIKTFDTPISNFRGFVESGTRIVFHGYSDFDVFWFTVYDKVLSDDINDIPTIYENRIKPDELVGDFAAFVELPRDANGNFIEGARIEGREVILPLSYRNVAMLKYESLPERITRSTGEISISPAAEHLLPILTAYFVWLDDEPTLAENYFKLYRDLVKMMKRKSGSFSCEYKDTLGWA